MNLFTKNANLGARVINLFSHIQKKKFFFSWGGGVGGGGRG